MKKLYPLLFLLPFLPFCVFSQSFSISTNQIDFGMLFYGDSDSVLVEITNLTNEDLEMEAPVFFDVYGSSPFYVNAYPTVLNVGQTASFYIVYEPLHNMLHNSEVIVVSNRGAAAIDLLGDCKYPQSYYNATYNLLDEELEIAFKSILANNQIDLGYNGARDKMYMEIDNKRVNGQGASQNTITRVYLGTDLVGFTSRSNAQSAFNVNTEHTFPQGFFNQALPMRADLHHLYVTDVNANSKRGNYAFGNVVSNITWQSGGSKLGNDQNGVLVFEPRDDHKGRTARSILYFLLRYQNYGNHVKASYEDTMRDWCFEVPPNAVDVKRNNDIFALQKNRNPFIDYPQYLHRIHNLRGYENRPQAGYVSVSTDFINFGDVSAPGGEVYHVLVTNYGNTSLTIANLDIAENTTSSFGFEEFQPGDISILPGESHTLPLICSATSSSDDLQALLQFNTTDATNPVVSIPISASFATGVDQLDAFADVIVAPNPFINQFEFKNLPQQISEIKIYDISGRVVFTYRGHMSRVHIPQLSGGIYQAVVALQNGEIFTRRIMKR